MEFAAGPGADHRGNRAPALLDPLSTKRFAQADDPIALVSPNRILAGGTGAAQFKASQYFERFSHVRPSAQVSGASGLPGCPTAMARLACKLARTGSCSVKTQVFLHLPVRDGLMVTLPLVGFVTQIGGHHIVT